MSEIFDDRPINPSQLPQDSGESVEVAAGVFIPANKVSLFWDVADRKVSVRQAIADINMVLVEVLPGVAVPRHMLNEWRHKMATEPEFAAAMDVLMNRMGRLNALRKPAHSVSSHLLSYGKQ